MFLKHILIFSLVTASLSLTAQKGKDNMELGIMLGGTNYVGDMTDSRFQEVNFAAGIMLRYNPNHNFSLRGSIFYGSINGDDANHSSEEVRKRNLDFHSPLFEFSGQVEWNLFGFDALGSRPGKRFTPYLFGGVGIFKFNPKSELEGTVYELQPLGTEGQGTTPLQGRKKYALTQVSLPFGAGIKLRIAPRFVLGLEYGPRFTFTDYLDDVSLTYVEEAIIEAQYGRNAMLLSNRSGEEQGPYDIITRKGNQRGDNKERDWYNWFGVTLSYTINLHKVKCYKF
jgi:opacity protein-like surface antigen